MMQEEGDSVLATGTERVHAGGKKKALGEGRVGKPLQNQHEVAPEVRAGGAGRGKRVCACMWSSGGKRVTAQEPSVTCVRKAGKMSCGAKGVCVMVVGKGRWG